MLQDGGKRVIVIRMAKEVGEVLVCWSARSSACPVALEVMDGEEISTAILSHRRK